MLQTVGLNRITTRTSEHTTPVLRCLHWLPVTFRIDLKVLLLVYKSLNGLGPKYIADIITEYKQSTQIIRIESVRNTKGSHKTRGVRF